MKKICIALIGVLSSVSLFAAEGDPDLSSAITALRQINASLTSWTDGAFPYLVACAVSFLVFWLGKKVFSIVFRWCEEI